MKTYRVFRTEASETVLTDQDVLAFKQPVFGTDGEGETVLAVVEDIIEEGRNLDEAVKRPFRSDEEILEEYMSMFWAEKVS